MYILHGSWRTPPQGDKDGDSAFILWAETSQVSDQAEREPARHPFAASARDLKRAWSELSPLAGDLLKRDAKESFSTLLLPSTREGPQPSLPILRDDEETPPQGKVKLAPWRVDAASVLPRDILGLLANLPPEEDTTPGV